MEYASNGSLRDYLDEAVKPSSGTWCQTDCDVAFGMKYIYSKGIHHRDLKAANILLDDHHGEVVAKVCDFGLAKCGIVDDSHDLP